jgi:pseudouridine synthase
VRLLFASRRFALEAIQHGRISINDAPVRSANAPTRATQDEIRVDGVMLEPNQRNVYIVMNKPKKFAGAREFQSRHVMNLISKKFGWFIPGGPLAKSASGIIILTNDPEQRDPRENIFELMEKEYWFKINKVITRRGLTKIKDRIEALHPANTNRTVVDLAQKNSNSSWINVTTMHARLHDMTRILKEADHEILAIERKRIGSLSVEDLPTGSWRRLSEAEVRDVVNSSVDKQALELREQQSEETQGLWQKLSQRWFKST